MSALFGESSPPTAARSRSSLFAEDEFPSAGASLFADDGPEAWAASGARAGSSTDVTRTLLTAETAQIPSAYTQIYDKLVGEFGSGYGVGTAAIAKVLDEAEVYDASRDRIWNTVVGKKDSLAREEVWVALAMAGLVAEGEEVSIDAVDDRRRNLPVPLLKSLAPSGPPVASDPYVDSMGSSEPSIASADGSAHAPASGTAPSTVEHPTPEQPKIVQHSSTQPISTSPIRTRDTSALFSHDAEDSPWGSPDQSRKMPPNTDGPGGSRPRDPTLPQPATRPGIEEEEEEIHEPDDIHAALRNTQTSRGSSGWEPGFAGDDGMGGYASPGGYGEPSVHPGMVRRPGSFGGLGGSMLNGGNNAQSGVERMRAALKGPEETVTISVLPEKEGMFMFQHRNYQIASTRRASRVVRRYSDFVWLLDCLHKRYPYRQLPLLPPKRLAVNGHYLSADNDFLDRRRRGLIRFTNALVRHPVLSQEQLVIMFLTVPTELSVWRKQANLSVMEEFENRPLPPDLEASLPPDLSQTFETVRSGLRKSSELYINLCTLMERLAKRNTGLSLDLSRFSGALRSLTDVTEATYAVDTNDIPLHNTGLQAVAAHMDTSRTLLDDEAQAWDGGVLEDLKRQRDTLVSMRELFDRYERLSDTIPALERRITANERKAMALRSRGEQAKPGEAERVEDSVVRDREEIRRQRERKVLVKECIRDELVFFQGSQYHVSRLLQDWAGERVKYSELQAECWRGLTSEVEAMPLGE